MAVINSFEDIKAFQKAREFNKEIYIITNTETFKTDFDLKRQIRRASVSVISNIAEGFERQTKKEFIQFLFIAKGSAGEVRAQLYIAKDLDYITNEQFNILKNKYSEVSKLIAGFIKYLKSSL